MLKLHLEHATQDLVGIGAFFDFQNKHVGEYELFMEVANQVFRVIIQTQRGYYGAPDGSGPENQGNEPI